MAMTALGAYKPVAVRRMPVAQAEIGRVEASPSLTGGRTFEDLVDALVGRMKSGQPDMTPYAGALRAATTKRDALRQEAIAAQPLPIAQELAQQRAAKARYQREVEGYQEPLPDMPRLELPAVPDRPAPEASPYGLLAGALAGFAAPEAAGTFMAAPLQSAVEAADREYQDRQKQFEVAVQQAKADHEGRMQQRSEELQRALHLTAAEGDLEGAKALGEEYRSLGDQMTAARLKDAAAAGAEGDVETALANFKAAQESQKQGAKTYETALKIASSLAETQSRIEQTAQEKAAQRAFLAAQNEANRQSRVQVVGMQQAGADARNAASIEGAGARNQARIAMNERIAARRVAAAGGKGFTNNPMLNSKYRTAAQSYLVLQKKLLETPQGNQFYAATKAAYDSAVTKLKNVEGELNAYISSGGKQPGGSGGVFRYDPATGKLVRK